MTAFSTAFYFIIGGLILFSKNWKLPDHLRLTVPVTASIIAICVYYYMDNNAAPTTNEFGMYLGPSVVGLLVFIADILSKRIVGRQFYLRAGFSKHYSLPGFTGDNDHLNIFDHAISIVLIFGWIFWPIIFETVTK